MLSRSNASRGHCPVKNVFCSLLRLATIASLSGVLLVPPPASAQTLRAAADRDGLLAGAAVAPRLFSQPAYAGTLAREFNMVEAENAMKWTATEPFQGQFDFAPGDQVVAFARAHDMKVRGHNLLWDKHNPAWLANGHFTAARLAQIMHTHIQTVAGHYAGKVFAWDVVNEAFDEQGRLKHTLWYDQPGIGLAGQGTRYIEQAFRWAHAADPHALLFYNDFNIATINAKSNAIYAMVRDFRRRGVPIDGVGLQLHHSNLNPASLSTLKANMARFAALGVQLHITELDVALPMDAHGQLLHRGDLRLQAEIYRIVAEACAEQPACTAFQTWGVTDRYSWIPKFTHGGKGDALMFDERYQPKPAWRAVLHGLQRSTPAVSGQRRHDCRCGGETAIAVR